MHTQKKETQTHGYRQTAKPLEQSSRQSESEESILQMLREIPGMISAYESLDGEWRRRFMGYFTGKNTLPLTYDPFFKRIFHPDVHPDRLSRFLSAILGQKVKVIHILPIEETMLDGGALLIMDILVELEDGALANVEIQKIPYLFPAQRMSCYSSDLVMRQYSRVKGEKGRFFKYSDLKPVYTIVIYEDSPAELREHPKSYIHHGKTAFDTGLSMGLLQEYWLIALDVFRKKQYPKKKDELTGWLSLLATEDMDEAQRLMVEYPWLTEIYQEMEGYLHEPGEVLNMFSEALRILDRNTVQYMIEQQQEQLSQKDAQLEQKDAQLEQKDAQLEQKDAQLKQKDTQIGQQQEQLEQQKAEIERLNRLLTKKGL